VAARKEPKKKPSETQLLRSQRRIAGRITRSMTELNQSLKDVAKDFGVSERELKKYLYQPRAVTSKNYNRNESFRKLYRRSGNVIEKEVMEKLPDRIIKGRSIPQRGKMVKVKVLSFEGDVRGVTPYKRGEGTEDQDRLYNRLLRSIKIESELPALSMSMSWQKYTSERGLPVSIEGIKEMYADGEISKRQVASILTHWHNIYPNMTDDWYSEIEDQFEELDELRD
jgi:hypothetical protein